MRGNNCNVLVTSNGRFRWKDAGKRGSGSAWNVLHPEDKHTATEWAGLAQR